MQKYDILLFDADNTLLDFTKSEFYAFRIMSETCGLPYSADLYNLYSQINDSLWKKLERKEITLNELKTERFRLLLLQSGRKCTKEDVLLLCRTYMEALGQQSFLIEGAEETVRALSLSYDLCLVTNGIASIQNARIENSKLKPYFSHIFISEEIGAAKPEPAFFESVMHTLHYPPKEKVLVIGDSLTSDCDGAINFGLDVCRYNPNSLPDNGRKITFSVKKLTDLLGILNEECENG